jgi:hypothetical protein
MPACKEIQEIIALYVLEPQLRDVYVEGPYDKNLIEWFLLDQDIDCIKIYTIDTINIPNTLLSVYNLDNNSNRSKIIALSKELSTKLPSQRNVLCIADRDTQDYFPCDQDNTYLSFTDYCSAELYLWQKKTVQKLICLVLGGFPLSADRLMTETIIILKELFLIRATNIDLKWNMNWIPFIKYLNLSNIISFDSDRFIEAYLLKNNKWHQKSAFLKKMDKIRNNLQDEPRRCTRGHDLINLLFYLIKKQKNKRKFVNPESFLGAFTGCLEAEDIKKETLFKKIVALNI